MVLYNDWSPCFKELEKIIKKLRFQSILKIPYCSKNTYIRTNEKGDVLYIRSSFSYKRSAGTLGSSLAQASLFGHQPQAAMNHTVIDHGYIELSFDNKILRSLCVYDHNSNYGNIISSSNLGSFPVHSIYFTGIDLSLERFIHNDTFIDLKEDCDMVFMNDLSDSGDSIMYDDLIEKLIPISIIIRTW